MTINVAHSSWMPEPTSEASRRECLGGLNTSPCTNFQPVSSKVSSCIDAETGQCVRHQIRKSIPALKYKAAQIPHHPSCCTWQCLVSKFSQWSWSGYLQIYKQYAKIKDTYSCASSMPKQLFLMVETTCHKFMLMPLISFWYILFTSHVVNPDLSAPMKFWHL